MKEIDNLDTSKEMLFHCRWSHFDISSSPFEMLQVTVVCRRIGGAFGGKASRALPVAAAAAVAAVSLGRPVRLVLNRNEDFRQNAGECVRPRLLLCPVRLRPNVVLYVCLAAMAFGHLTALSCSMDCSKANHTANLSWRFVPHGQYLAHGWASIKVAAQLLFIVPRALMYKRKLKI